VRHVVQLVLAGLAIAGAVLSWLRSSRVVDVAPIADGQPATTSVVYHAPMLLLTLGLATAAGVLLVLGIAGLVRARNRRRAQNTRV